jgi:hypothetical protein
VVRTVREEPAKDCASSLSEGLDMPRAQADGGRDAEHPSTEAINAGSAPPEGHAARGRVRSGSQRPGPNRIMREEQEQVGRLCRSQVLQVGAAAAAAPAGQLAAPDS